MTLFRFFPNQKKNYIDRNDSLIIKTGLIFIQTNVCYAAPLVSFKNDFFIFRCGWTVGYVLFWPGIVVQVGLFLKSKQQLFRDRIDKMNYASLLISLSS
jgi:hypothetical protein